jgi:hypothetical protein
MKLLLTKRSDIYRAAADLVDRIGWARHKFQHRNGKMCMMGAIRKVALGSALDDSKDRWLNLPLVQNITGGRSAVSFDDVHCKTRRDVVAALCIVADIQQTKGD